MAWGPTYSDELEIIVSWRSTFSVGGKSQKVTTQSLSGTDKLHLVGSENKKKVFLVRHLHWYLNMSENQVLFYKACRAIWLLCSVLQFSSYSRKMSHSRAGVTVAGFSKLPAISDHLSKCSRRKKKKSLWDAKWMSRLWLKTCKHEIFRNSVEKWMEQHKYKLAWGDFYFSKLTWNGDF